MIPRRHPRLPPAPYAVWDFLDGSGQQARDLSGSGRRLTLGSTTSTEANDPTWTAGAGLVFDGTDDSTYLPLSGTWTTGGSVVIAVNVTYQAGVSGRIVSLGNGATTNRLTLWTSASDSASWEYANNTGTTTPIGFQPFAYGSPVVVSVRWNASGTAGQYNTSPIISAPVTLNPFSPTALNLGNATQSLGLNRQMKGSLYFCAVYDRTLTDLEFSQAYQALKFRMAARNIFV